MSILELIRKGLRNPEYILPYLRRELPIPPDWYVTLSHWEGGWKRYLAATGLCREPFKMALRNQSPPYYMCWRDRDVLTEFYREDGYEDLQLSAYDTVVDIGAHIGVFTIYASRNGATVYAFEPSPDSYTSLLCNLALYDVTEEVVAHNTAVSSLDGYVDISLHGEESLADSTARDTGGETRTVPSKTLASIMDSVNTDGNCLIKMDCEGAEFKILQECSEGIFDGVDTVFIEYHRAVDDPVVLVDTLSEFGYSVTERPDPRDNVADELGFLLAER